MPYVLLHHCDAFWNPPIISEMSHSMTKPTKGHVRPVKTQISLGICPVGSESLLSAWRNKWVLSYPWSALRIIWSDSDYYEHPIKISDQPAHRHSLIRVCPACSKKLWVQSTKTDQSAQMLHQGHMWFCRFCCALAQLHALIICFLP